VPGDFVEQLEGDACAESANGFDMPLPVQRVGLG
jgi:hypothetical protein